MNPSNLGSLGRCENVTVRTSDGRVYDLGSPYSMLFRLRVLVYRIRRWKES